MTTTGVVINGMIKPDHPLDLHDGDHVRFEILEQTSSDPSRNANGFLELAAAIRAQIKGPIRFTRDELHERR